MEDDIVVRGVVLVPVLRPVLGGEVNFDWAAPWLAVDDQSCVVKVGAGFDISDALMQDGDFFAIDCPKRLIQPLLIPDDL